MANELPGFSDVVVTWGSGTVPVYDGSGRPHPTVRIIVAVHAHCNACATDNRVKK